MKLQLLKKATVKDLYDSVPANLERYRIGDFAHLKADPGLLIESQHEFDPSALALIHCTKDDDREVENCVAVWNALHWLSPYLARDERLWTFLTHVYLLEYSRTRWPIPKDDETAIKEIRRHFFVSGGRGFERDNAVARLWWMAYLCDKAEGLSLHDSLKVLLYKYDVRANIMERPTTSQSIHVFSAVLKKLKKSYDGDKSLFEREAFRSAMRELNLIGGTKLLPALSSREVDHFVDSCF